MRKKFISNKRTYFNMDNVRQTGDEESGYLYTEKRILFTVKDKKSKTIRIYEQKDRKHKNDVRLLKKSKLQYKQHGHTKNFNEKEIIENFKTKGFARFRTPLGYGMQERDFTDSRMGNKNFFVRVTLEGWRKGRYKKTISRRKNVIDYYDSRDKEYRAFAIASSSSHQFMQDKNIALQEAVENGVQVLYAKLNGKPDGYFIINKKIVFFEGRSRDF